MARPRSDEARRRLVTATVEIITTGGVGAVTADDVARRSGVAKTTLYRHFGSIEAMVFAAVDDSVTASTPPDTGSLRDDLRIIHRRYLDAAASARTRELFAWMVSTSIRNPEHRDRFRSIRAQPRGSTTVALQRAIARGELDADTDLDLALHVIQGPLISQRIVDDRDVSDDELDRLLDAALRALAVRSADRRGPTPLPSGAAAEQTRSTEPEESRP